MKKIIIPVTVVSALLLVSCKKNYTCVYTGNPGTNSSNSTEYIIKDTKSKAESACKAYVPNIWNECHIK